jgi:DHA1 family bicyclomycin/chloramphenicol resistance-like MFS transporter
VAESRRRARDAIGSFLSFDRNVLVMSFTGLLINFGAQVFQPFVPLYLQALNANIPEIGIVYVGLAVATNLVTIPGGILADKIGRKTVIVLGNAIGFGSFFVLLLINDWTEALLVLFLATLFSQLVQPAYSSTVAESVEVKNRSNAFGTFYVLVTIGLAFGSIVGGYLPNPGKFQLNIWVIAVVGIAAAFSRGLFLKETLPREARADRNAPAKRFFLVRLSRNIWLILLAWLLYNFFSGLGQPLYAIFATDQLQLSQSEFAVMIGVSYLASMFGAFGAGKVSRRFGVRNMMISTVVLAGMFLIPWIYAPNAFLAIILFAISGFFLQFFFVGNQTLMANVTQAEERSSVIGFITTVAGVGGIVAPYVGSQLWVIFNPKIPFLLSVLMAGLVAVPIALIHETGERLACPHCGRQLPKEASFCDDCGRPIRFKRCNSCGRILEELARFCDSCGRAQVKNSPSS